MPVSKEKSFAVSWGFLVTGNCRNWNVWSEVFLGQPDLFLYLGVAAGRRSQAAAMRRLVVDLPCPVCFMISVVGTLVPQALSMSYLWVGLLMIPWCSVRTVSRRIWKTYSWKGESLQNTTFPLSTPGDAQSLKHSPYLKPRHGRVFLYHQRFADSHVDTVVRLILAFTAFPAQRGGGESRIFNALFEIQVCLLGGCFLRRCVWCTGKYCTVQ